MAAKGAVGSMGRFSAGRRAAAPARAAQEPELAPESANQNEQVEADAAEADIPAEEQNLTSRLLDAKVRLHRQLIDEIDLAAMERIPEAELRKQITEMLGEHVLSERLPLNAEELDAFADELFDEMTGLGPIEPLLADPTISDILINTHSLVFVERHGQLEETPVRFKDEAHLLRILNKIVAGVGRRVDESQPMVDARLEDGSRVNAVIRPLAVDGPLISIRKFSKKPLLARQARRLRQHPAANGGSPGRRRQGPRHRDRFGRHGQRQDHHAERAFQLHFAQGAAGHH